jgi:outer membrane protein
MGWSQPLWHYWHYDPFDTEATVAPSPGMRWEPDKLPSAAARPPARQPLPTKAPLTLAELTELALKNNPRSRQAWFAARAAAAGVGIEKAGELPQITAGYSIARNRPVSATTGAVADWQTRYGPSVSLSYVLYDFGLGDDRVAAAEYRLLAANLAQNRVLQEVVFQVEQAYYQVLGIEALVRTNELSLQNNRTALEAVKRRRESGLATVADVYRVETQVAQAQLNLIRSQGELEKAKGQLAIAVGLPVSESLRVQTLPDQPQVHQVTEAVSTLLERAKAQRPDLAAAEAQVLAARAAAQAASKAGLPSIEVSSASAHNVFHDNRPSSTSYSLSLNLRIPLFAGFRDTYAVRQAEALAAQAEAARDLLYTQTELDVWRAYFDLRSAVTGIVTTEAQVKSAQQTAQATLARYQAGFGTILDLITAQQDESNARVQRIQSYLDWFTALARLNFSIGGNNLMAAGGRK